MYHSLSFKPQGNFKEIAKVVKKTTDPETKRIKYDKTKKALYVIEQDKPFDVPINRIELKNDEQFFPSAVKHEGGYSNRSFFAGSTLSGKSYLANKYAHDYIKQNRKNKVVLFTGVENSDYADIKNLHRIRIDDSILDNPIKLEELHDSLCIFDDILAIPDKEHRNEICKLRDRVLSAGRHVNCDCLVLQQNMMDGFNTKSTLNNCFQVAIFPRSSGKHQASNYLERYMKLPKDKIREIMGRNSRWVLINLVNPNYTLTEHDCQIGY